MNRQAKSGIKSLVLTLRHKLEEDIAIGLKRYGFAGERWRSLEELLHIERDDAATADHFRLRAALEQHLRRIGAEPEVATPALRGEAVEWFVREVAFTHLNRLAALKCLESRGLIPEIITVRDAYGGRARAHYEYRFDHPAEAAAADDALPAAIRHVCRRVYPEFRLLFDVGDPAAGRKPPADDIVWPSYPVLRECIGLINGLDEAADSRSQMADDKSQMADGGRPNEAAEANHVSRFTFHESRSTSLWMEDEIIGWIYQFYNAEQKEAIRKRGAPRRPAEVAVINQFFTPRWIVKFLVDNTLGRLWLEMHPDSPRVRAKCDYLVPEPLGGGAEENPQSAIASRQFMLDPDSPINHPKAPARRKAKRPQDIRLIDPACGAMHFGHYAFEVFYEIYLDYYELYADRETTNGENQPSAISDLPSAILRCNLYGVDIDLRAVQLAALSLFIKAKTANPDAHITRMNLVVADAVLPADGARAQFLARYKDDKVVQDAVREVLDEMANVAEVGSLLRVEERLRSILAKAGHRAAEDTARLDPRTQRPLPGMGGKGGQFALADLPEAQPGDWGAHYTVARLLDDLREFAAQALQTHDLNAQLFAEETEKSVHLLDVFLNDYDVAVMNPPYGGTTGMAQARVSRDYPEAGGDLYAAFMMRGLDMLRQDGYLGALTSRTYLTLAAFEEFRSRLVLNSWPVIVFDLGFGVLDDALVETCLSVICNTDGRKGGRPVSFFRKLTDEEFNQVKLLASRTVLTTVELGRIPGYQFAYRAPHELLRSYVNAKARIQDSSPAKMGLGTGRDEVFLRHHWEISHSSHQRAWIAYSKGGDFSRYYADTYLMIDWTDEGRPMLKYPGCRLQGRDYYGRSGITWPWITVKGFNARLLPAECMFANISPLLPVCKSTSVVQDLTRRAPKYDERDWFAMLAYLNSEYVSGLLDLITPSRNYTVGQVNQLPALPPGADLDSLARLGHACFAIKGLWDTGNETCTRFTAPWLIQAHRGALLRTMADGQLTAALDPPSLPVSQSIVLPVLLDHLLAVEHAADARLQQLQAEIDDAVYELYKITPEDRALIERELGNRPPELVWPQMEGKSDEEKRREHVRRLVSYFLLQAVREKRDGILPVTPVAGEASALDAVRRGLEAEFGEAAAFRMESDIGTVLGQPLADWLDGSFVKWHTSLYKRRPVIWHLASPKNGFGCLIYIHKLDADTLRKVQTLYLWPRRRAVEAERDEAIRAKQAGAAGASRRLEAAEALLDDLAEFEKRLLSVIQAQVKCEIPDWAEGPFRNGVYDPVQDDGVKVNITPLQEAGVLRYGKVV